MRGITRITNYAGYSLNSPIMKEHLYFVDESKPEGVGSPNRNFAPIDSEIPFDLIPEGRI
jgi:hypothetical protein